MNTKNTLTKVIAIHSEISDLEAKSETFNKSFFDKLEELYRISRSICKKLGIDLSLTEKIFKNNLSYLQCNPYYMKQLKVRNISSYAKNVECEYLLGYNNKLTTINIPLSHFSMSDRDFATLIRKEIKKYKNTVKEEQRRSFLATLNKNKKLIKELQKENDKLEQIVREITEDQEKREKKIQAKMLNKTERQTNGK